MRRRVYLASPWRGNHSRNADYALAAMRDSLRRGEAPFASHVLYASCGVLDDEVEAERIAGIEAGAAWLAVAEAVVVYTDRGVSEGMRAEIEAAERLGIPVERRSLGSETHG